MKFFLELTEQLTLNQVRLITFVICTMSFISVVILDYSNFQDITLIALVVDILLWYYIIGILSFFILGGCEKSLNKTTKKKVQNTH